VILVDTDVMIDVMGLPLPGSTRSAVK